MAEKPPQPRLNTQMEDALKANGVEPSSSVPASEISAEFAANEKKEQEQIDAAIEKMHGQNPPAAEPVPEASGAEPESVTVDQSELYDKIQASIDRPDEPESAAPPAKTAHRRPRKKEAPSAEVAEVPPELKEIYGDEPVPAGIVRRFRDASEEDKPGLLGHVAREHMRETTTLPIPSDIRAIYGRQLPPDIENIVKKYARFPEEKRKGFVESLRADFDAYTKKRPRKRSAAHPEMVREERKTRTKKLRIKNETVPSAIERMQNEGGVAPDLMREGTHPPASSIDDMLGKHRHVGMEPTRGKTIEELVADEMEQEAAAAPEAPKGVPAAPEPSAASPEATTQDKWGGYPQAYSALLKLLKEKYGKDIPADVQANVSEVNRRFLAERSKEERNPAELAACTAIVQSISEHERTTPIPKKAEEPASPEAAQLPGAEGVVLEADGTRAENKRSLASAVKALEDLAEANRKKAGYIDYTETPHVDTNDREKAWKDQVEKMQRLAKGQGKEGEKSKMERLKGYLADRAKKLDAVLLADRDMEKGFRWLGETYDKSNWKTKLAVNVGLGVGAGVSAAAVSLPAIIGFSAAIALGRVGALSSSFRKFEKNASSKEMAMLKAMLYTAGTSAGMVFLTKEVAESEIGAKAAEWSKEGAEWVRQHFLGGVSVKEVPPPIGIPKPAVPEAMHPIDEPHIARMAGIPEQSPALPSVEAGKGHGYEWMAKRLWEQVHESGRDIKAPEGSDLEQLMNADEKSIDSVVHRLAIENGAFENGQSAVISPESHLAFDADGNLSFDKELVMPASGPAVAGIDYPDAAAEMAAPSEISAGAPTIEGTVPPAEEPYPMIDQPSGRVLVGPDLPLPEGAGGVSHEAAAPEVPVATPEVMYTAGDHTPIDITKPAIYEAHAADGSSYLAAYGGTDDDRIKFVNEYLVQPGHEGQSVRLAYDVPSKNGALLHVEDVGAAKHQGFFATVLGGIFGGQLKAPSPDTFLRKVSP